MNEDVQEIGHIVVALETVVATMLQDLTEAGALGRDEYITYLRTAEELGTKTNQHAGAIALFRRLRKSLGDENS